MSLCRIIENDQIYKKKEKLSRKKIIKFKFNGQNLDKFCLNVRCKLRQSETSKSKNKIFRIIIGESRNGWNKTGMIRLLCLLKNSSEKIFSDILFIECWTGSISLENGRTGSHLIEKPRRKDHLEQVVDYQGVLKLERFPILHQFRSEHLDDVYVGETDEQRGERWAHQ